MAKIKYCRIKRFRLEHGFTQKQMAGYLQIRQDAYSRKECGDIAFTLKEAAKLALLYETSIDYLCGLTDEKTPHKRS